MSLNAGDWTVIQQVITPTSQILDATVARLYKSGIGGKRWEYTRKLGAAVLVSENSKLSLVLIDLSSSTVSFHYDFSNPFFYFELKPYFHSFQMDETNELGGLSFANEQEAQSFFATLCRSVFYCDKCEASCYHGSGFDHEGTNCCTCNVDIGVPASNRFSRSMTLPVMNPPPTVTKSNVNTTKPLPTKPLQKSATVNQIPSTTNHSRNAVNENILGQAFAKNFALGGNHVSTRDSRSESEPTQSSTQQPVIPPKFNRGSNTSQSPPSTSPYISPTASNRSSLRSSVSGSSVQGATPIVSITPGSVPLVSILPPGMRRSQSLISPNGMANGPMPAAAMPITPAMMAQPQQLQPEESAASSTLTKKELKKLEKEQKEREKKEAKQKEKERKEQKEREKKEKERLEKEKERLEKEKKKQKKAGISPPMEISGPTDFQHVSSIGYNQITHTFEIKNIPPQWKQIFRDAGITKKQLQNSETASFIYDVVVNGKQSVDSMGTVERKPSLSNRPPPPPPAPAPPPIAPTLPPTHAQTYRQVPQPPQTAQAYIPHHQHSTDSDRPPTPPLEDEEAYPSTPSTPSSSTSPNTSRSGLLNEIHAGIQLRSTKSVNENIQQATVKQPEGNGLAETLARAMMQRREVLQEHNDDLEDDEDDDWDD